MIAGIAVLAATATALLIGWTLVGGRAADLPWAPLDLSGPVGWSTPIRLARLDDRFADCRALLDQAGVRYVALPPRVENGGQCGYRDGVRLLAGGALTTALAPAAPPLACPLAASVAMWNWTVVQPAALRSFGSPVATVLHYGSYNCRRIAGSGTHAWSEHAHANAIDVAGFRLADGRTVTVARDWNGDGAPATFLHRVRNGACRLFATTLSPDYNTAHHDHLHLDEAPRGRWGGRACR